MTMQETEEDILRDLTELSDPISRYTYLIACASECRPMPGEEHLERYLIRECQMHTWVSVVWREESLHMEVDSQSLIVKGALALLQEIYDNRSSQEVRGYRCRLLEEQIFAEHFTLDQIRGLRAILGRLEKS